jgi:hypothetical protein
MIGSSNHLCDTHRQPKPILVKGAWRTSVASFAFPSKTGSTDFHATKHPTDACPLSGRVMYLILLSFNLYLPHYRTALASSVICPHTSNSMPYGLPASKGEGMGLARSADLTTDTLGPLSLPVGVYPGRTVFKHPNHPLTFWFKPLSSFGLLSFTTVTSVHLC